jgi:hypothetical protein
MIMLGAGFIFGLTVAASGPVSAEPAPAQRIAAADDLHAQQDLRPSRRRIRIEVRPSGEFYRQCVDGYREVYRPYWGTTVVMPFMHCRWVRG